MPGQAITTSAARRLICCRRSGGPAEDAVAATQPRSARDGFLSTLAILSQLANDWNRRASLIPARPGEGRLTKPTTAVQPWRREPLFLPLSGRQAQR